MGIPEVIYWEMCPSCPPRIDAYVSALNGFSCYAVTKLFIHSLLLAA